MVHLGIKELLVLPQSLVRENRLGGEFLEDQIYLVLHLPVLLLNLLLLNLQAIWTATA